MKPPAMQRILFYIIYLFLYGLQVCLDYWNSLVLELFEARHTMDGPAGTVSLMGLQVSLIDGSLIDAFAVNEILDTRVLFLGDCADVNASQCC